MTPEFLKAFADLFLASIYNSVQRRLDQQKYLQMASIAWEAFDRLEKYEDPD